MIEYENYKSKIDEVDIKIASSANNIEIGKNPQKALKIKPIWVFGIVFFGLIVDFVASIVNKARFIFEATILTGAIGLIYLLYCGYVYKYNEIAKQKDLKYFHEQKALHNSNILERYNIFAEFVKINNGKIFYSVSGEQDFGIWRENDELILANLSSGLQLEIINIDTIAYVTVDSYCAEDNGMDGFEKIINCAIIVFKTNNRMLFTDKAYKYLSELLYDINMDKNIEEIKQTNEAYGDILVDEL